MICPQCATETPDSEWNCSSCRINLYWASQHYEELAEIRGLKGLTPGNASPSFLVQAHREVMDERADHGGKIENRVRAVARKVMRGKS